jgi:hypothetical protein
MMLPELKTRRCVTIPADIDRPFEYFECGRDWLSFVSFVSIVAQVLLDIAVRLYASLIA